MTFWHRHSTSAGVSGPPLGADFASHYHVTAWGLSTAAIVLDAVTHTHGTPTGYVVVPVRQATARLDVIEERGSDLLQALLPHGDLWSRDPDTNLMLLTRALSYEYGRVKRRGRQLLDELDPRTTYELLEDLERVYGLSPAANATLAQRRAALRGRMLGNADPTPAFFISLAASFGYTVTIDTFQWDDCFNAVSPCTAVLRTRQWMFYWQVNTSHGSSDADLEAAFEALKPLHTILAFHYA